MAIVWRRGKVKVNRLLGNAPPEIRTVHESACPLPSEIVEMIIAHLTHNLHSLKACSLICRSWYIVAVPHLHHTLRLSSRGRSDARMGLKPLSKLHELRLMSFVQEIKVYEFYLLDPWFVPQAFSRRDLRYWAAFANVQTLELSGFQIYHFIPGIERYFQHFSPTLRSIMLHCPRCTPRQLSHFLSLFSNLDNIWISGIVPPSTIVPNTELVPFSTPKLRGRLVLAYFWGAGAWTYLIAPSNGLRFHYVDLCSVGDCAPVLLEACAETMETLRIHATDESAGKRFSVDLSADSS